MEHDKKTYTTREMMAFLPDFVDAEYPKRTGKKEGRNERSPATLAIVRFICWLQQYGKHR